MFIEDNRSMQDRKVSLNNRINTIMENNGLGFKIRNSSRGTLGAPPSQPTEYGGIAEERQPRHGESSGMLSEPYITRKQSSAHGYDPIEPSQERLERLKQLDN